MSNNIEALNDFEINKRVAFHCGLQVQEINDTKATGMTTRYHELCPNTVWVSDGNEPWYQFAPCNSGEDAWPLILEDEISIIFNWNEQGLHGAVPCFPAKSYEHTNALRAAMIVYLMRRENLHD